jgi:hypothetical protein
MKEDIRSSSFFHATNAPLHLLSHPWWLEYLFWSSTFVWKNQNDHLIMEIILSIMKSQFQTNNTARWGGRAINVSPMQRCWSICSHC